MYKRKKRLDTEMGSDMTLNDSGDKQFTISWDKEFQIGIILTKKKTFMLKF